VPVDESSKSRVVTIAQSLEPGYWNDARLVLDGVPPARFGFLRVKQLTHGGLRLRFR
jgi:hypothetical protein